MARGVHPYLSRATSLAASPAAMALVAAGVAYWAATADDFKGIVDAILSGGALLYGQAIYRESEPRDIAMHKKLDNIIHGTDADDAVAGCEEE